MNIRQRLQLAFAALLGREPSAQYEAGQLWNPRRSRIPGWIRDARFDADNATRLEIVRKSRYFERNSAIVNRLADLFEEYTVGPNGLRFVPSSSDVEWNAAMSQWFAEWCGMCDLTSRMTFGTIQSLAARTWFVDGEVFIIKTRGRERANGQSFPRIQLIETHRVCTPPDQSANPNIIDGIEIDPDTGRPIKYWISQQIGNGEETSEPYDAQDVVHIYEPSRPGMYRGLPFLYPVLNDLHDLDDLQLLSMDGFKEWASTNAIIKTKSGELSADDFRRARFSVSGTQGTSGGSSQDRNRYYEEVFRGKARVLQKDDEYEQPGIQRPSETERALWDYLTSKVCAGTGISKLLVFPWSVQGTVVRADLDVMGSFFRSRSSVLAAGFTDVYYYVVGFARNNVKELADPPADFRKVKVRPPRSVNVDVGRNSTALINEYLAGFRTLEGICGELGEDWVEVLEQEGAELAKAAEIENRLKLAPGSLIKKALEALQQKMATDTQQQQQQQSQEA